MTTGKGHRGISSISDRREVRYSVPWPVSNARPGAHPGSQRGVGQRFLGYLGFLDYPDPRRLDLKASALDPFGIARVRSYARRGAISVIVVADLSASMGFSGSHRKLQTVARLVSDLAASVGRYGDRFGFLGCDNRVRTEWILPPGCGLGGAQSISRRLSDFEPKPSGGHGLLDSHLYLPQQRSLVLVASDFHLDDTLINRLLESVMKHEVIPLVLWDKEEFSGLPERGLVRMRDPESGRYRTQWLRPGLRRRIEDRYAERKAQLVHLFQRFGRRPVFFLDGFEAGLLNEYFLSQ